MSDGPPLICETPREVRWIANECGDGFALDLLIDGVNRLYGRRLPFLSVSDDLGEVALLWESGRGLMSTGIELEPPIASVESGLLTLYREVEGLLRGGWGHHQGAAGEASFQEGLVVLLKMCGGEFTSEDES